MKLRVLIAAPDREFQRMMTEQVSAERDMETADVASDGLEVLAKIKTACCLRLCSRGWTECAYCCGWLRRSESHRWSFSPDLSTILLPSAPDSAQPILCRNHATPRS